MRFAFMLFTVVGCTDEDPSADGPPTDDGTDGPTDGTGPDTADTDVPVLACPDGPGVCGILLDPAGEPLGDYDVLCCMSTTCFKGETEDDGFFYFEVEPIEFVAIKTHEELFEAPRWAAALVPASIDTPQAIDVGNVYIPDLPAGVEIGDESEDPQTLAVGDGLELTLNSADLDPDLGVFLFDIAARRIPDEYVPDYPTLDETVEAVYAIHPFATASSSPIAVKAPSTLPAGTLVNVWTVSHLTGQLTGPVVGHTDGQFVTTDPGLGITLLTHIVVSAP